MADTKMASTPSSGQSSGDSSTGSAVNKDQIKGTTRNSMLPFYLDGKSSNQGETVQRFSFRQKDCAEAKLGLINMIPTDRGEFNKDLGAKLLIAKNYTDPSGKTAQSPNLQTLLNEIPAIQIREYTQDTRLDVIWGAVNSFIKGFKTGSGEQDADTFDETKDLTKSQLAYFGGRLAKTIKSQKWWSQLLSTLGSWLGTQLKTMTGGSLSDDEKTKLVISAVYCLYYRMIGATTTNMYMLPYNGTDIYNTDGKAGWPAPGGWDSATTNHSNLGKMLNFAFGNNLKIVTQPIWSGSTGGATTQITVQMDLFNDTDEHALNNFIFVNTICPSNMFLQYGIWQLPPSVYDIKIEGGRRWFMCKGSMTCSAKGVMRNPPRSFMDALNGHRNKSLFKSDIQEAFIKNRIVKIPDVYSLNMQFESCLPDNFNHILFQYCANDNIKDKEGMREEGWWDTCTEVKGYVDSTIKGIADDAKSQQLSSDAEGAKEGYKKDELIP